MGRAAERLGDSNPTPRGSDDDLFVRGTAVWLRNPTAAILQYSVAVLPFFPCLLSSETGEQLRFLHFSRLSSPKIPKHRNHSTYLLYLLFRCRLHSLALSEHQEHLPLQEQNQQLLLLLHVLFPESLLQTQHRPFSGATSSLSVAPNQAPGTPSDQGPFIAGDRRGLNSPLL